MNYTGYSVLKVTKNDGAYSYGLDAYSLATGSTGAGGYLSSYANSTIDFIHGITSGNYPLPTGGLQSSDFVYTGEAIVIGGATPNGDIRGEATGFYRFGTTTPYSLEKNTQYSGALYAVYKVSPSISHYQKIGIGTNLTQINASGYYEGDFTTRNINEFESSYIPDFDDPTKIITGSGIYKNGSDVSLKFNILNRNKDLLTSSSEIAADPFVDKQIFSILDSDSNVVFPNYRTNGDSTFTFSRSQNIDVFGSYNRNFGIRNEIVNQDGGISTGEFYLYANTATFDKVIVQASGETSLNENPANNFPPNTGGITSAIDRADAIKYFNNQPINASGSTGFIEITLNFNESPNFTNLGDVNIWNGTSGDFTTNRGSFVGSYPLNLLQEGQKIELTSNDGLKEGTGLFFKLVADSDVGFEPEVFTIGPYTLEPNVEGPDLNVYNQSIGQQIIVSDLSIQGGVDGNAAQGGHLGIGTNAVDSTQMLVQGNNASVEIANNEGYSVSTEQKAAVASVAGNIYSTGSMIAGGSGHHISGDFDTIAGGMLGNISGGDFNFIGGGSGVDIVDSFYSSSVGGFNNDISGSSYSIIGGGENNVITGSSFSFIGGGSNNKIDESPESIIIGGRGNLIKTARGGLGYNLVGAGNGNEVIDSTNCSTLGYDNDITGAINSVIFGGVSNKINGADGVFQVSTSSIFGGENNIISSGITRSISLVGKAGRVDHDGAVLLGDGGFNLKHTSGDNTATLNFANGVYVETTSGLYLNGNPVMTGTNSFGGDTLQTVTTRGNVTTTSIKAAHISGSNLTLGNGVTDASIQLDGDFGGGDLTLQNLGSNQDIFFKVNDGGVTTTPFTIQGSTSNVGIHTTSPSETFDVRGDVFVSGNASFQGVNKGYVRARTARANTSDYTSTSSSILTLGNYFGQNEYGQFVDNAGDFVIQKSGLATHLLKFSPTDMTVSGYGIKFAKNQTVTSLAVDLRNENGDEVGFYSPATNEIGFVTDRTEHMRIDSAGNVGVGTENPNSTFHVEGVVSGSNSFLGTGVGNRITNNGVPYLLSGDSPAENDTLQDVTTRGNETTTSIISTGPYISGVTGLFSNKVGIGTATPDDALTIVGTSADFSIRKADNNLAARIVQFSAGGAQLRLYDSGSNETIRLAGDGSNSFITGNVGIGTVSPSSALEVRGGNIDIGTNDIEGAANCKIEMDAADGFTLTNPNNAHGVDIVADDLTFFGGGLGNRKITTNAGDLSIDPTADLLLNETAGNVGIGTDSPTERVEVSGSLLLGPRSSSPGDTMPFLKIDGYDEHGIEMGLSTWTRWRITTKVNGQLEIYNTGVQHQSQQVSIGRRNYHKQGNLLVYSTGSVLRAGHNSANYSILDIGVQDANTSYQGDAYIDVRADTSPPSRFHFKRDGEFIASGVSVSGDVLGTGVGNRITNNHVPYLLSGDSLAETQTLQDVCDNGNTTTTSIISTGPHISGVTGYYKDTLRVGDGGFVDFPSEYDTLQVGTSSSATNGHILVRGKESSITFRGVEGSDKAHTIKEDGGTLTFYGDSTLSGTAGNARFAIQTGQSYFTDLAGVQANGKKPQFYLASIGGGASNKATHFYQPANSADFRIALNGSQHNGTIGTDAFAIKSTYEIGVGTTDPRAALHVDNGAGAPTGFLVENSSNKNILWAEDNESINARSTFNVYHTTVSSRYLKLGWGSIFANDNGNELTLGSNYSSNSATRIFVGAEGATNVPANTIQMQANYGLAVFSGVSTDTFDPTALLDVRGDAYISGSVEGTGAGNRITNNGVPYLLSGDSPAGTQTLQDVCDNGNTTTTAVQLNGGVVVNEGGSDLDFRVEGDTATHALFVNGADNHVGIGTATPISDLTVYSSDSNTATVSIHNINNNETGSLLRLVEGNNHMGGFLQFDGSANKFNIGVHSTNDTTFANDTKAITIDRDTANVGVGTQSPDAHLNVYNTGITSSVADVHIVGSGNTYGLLYERLRNDSFIVSKSTTAGSYVRTDSATSSFQGYEIGNNWFLGQYGYNDFRITDGTRSGGTAALTIQDSTQNVGIGTTSPLGKLHVRSANAGSFTYDTNADDLIVESNANGGLTIATAAANTSRVIFASPDDATGGEISFNQTAKLMKIGPTTSNGLLALQSANGVETMRLDASNNVGIGTTSPSFTSGGGLQITNANQANLRLSDSSNASYNLDLAMSNDDFYLVNRSATGHLKFRVNNTTEAITVLQDGKVGLGATNPNSILDIRDTQTGGASEIKLFNLDQGNTTTQTSALVMSPDLRANGVKIAAAKENADFSSSANKDVAITLSPVLNNTATERVRIKSDGKVGIGTTNPAAKLELLGKQMITTGANASPQTEDYLYIGGDGLGSADAAIYIGNRGNGSGYGWRMFYEGTGSGNDNKLKFKSENLGSPVDVITMLQDGKVGIGATAPSVGLQLGNSASGETKTAIFNSEGGAEIGLTIKSRTNRAKLAVSDNDTTAYVVAEGTIASFGKADTAASTNISVLTDGSVGIGSTSPTRLLTLENDSATVTNNSQLRINNAGAGDAYIYLFAGSDWSLGIDNSDSDKFKLCTTNDVSDGTEVVTVDRSGNVGIGTTSPTRKLTIKTSTGSRNNVIGINDASGTEQATIALDTNTNDVNIAGKANLRFYSGSTLGGVASLPTNERVVITTAGNVGIGTTSPSNALDVVGHFSATSKSFLINHPTKKNKKLQYASLEGPENGVYVRGTTDKETIELPEYWSELVHEDSITVVLTPIGKKQDLFIKEKSNKLIKIGGAEGSFDYLVYGERKDIDKLETEPLKV